MSAMAQARSCAASSGAQRTALLELYTSEGCSSCPPAEAWLSRLPTRQLDHTKVVPLAFHVDYWDYLGWKDPFAQHRFSARQRQYALRQKSTFVFTPQLVLNGENYRPGLLFDGIETSVKATNRLPASAEITIELKFGPRQLFAAVEAVLQSGVVQPAQLFVAVYENNLATSVAAGENKGRLLQHQYVVRDLSAPLSLQPGRAIQQDYTWRTGDDWKIADLGVAAYIENPVSGDVLQAVAVTCR
jgi:hypothetical protein